MSRFSLVATTTGTLPIIVPLDGDSLKLAVADADSEKNAWMFPDFIIDYEQKKTYRVGRFDEGLRVYNNAESSIGPASLMNDWVEISLEGQ